LSEGGAAFLCMLLCLDAGLRLGEATGRIESALAFLVEPLPAPKRSRTLQEPGDSVVAGDRCGPVHPSVFGDEIEVPIRLAA
jgi:hypothetical protein